MGAGALGRRVRKECAMAVRYVAGGRVLGNPGRRNVQYPRMPLD